MINKILSIHINNCKMGMYKCGGHLFIAPELKQLVHESALCIYAEQNVKNAELRRGSSERWSNPRSEISRNAFVNFSSSLYMRSMILADVAHPPVEFRDLIAGDDAGAAAAG